MNSTITRFRTINKANVDHVRDDAATHAGYVEHMTAKLVDLGVDPETIKHRIEPHSNGHYVWIGEGEVTASKLG